MGLAPLYWKLTFAPAERSRFAKVALLGATTDLPEMATTSLAIGAPAGLQFDPVAQFPPEAGPIQVFVAQLPLLIRTETLFDPLFATAASGRPSPLKSPTATDAGAVPAAKVMGFRIVVSPFPSQTSAAEPVTTASSLPSLLK